MALIGDEEDRKELREEDAAFQKPLSSHGR